MIETHTVLEKPHPKTTSFIGNVSFFERRNKNGFKKTPGFKWFIDETKYLNEKEVGKLLRVSKKNKEKAERKGKKIAIRNYYLIKVGLSTGLRVQEIADLKCGDFHLGEKMSYVIVWQGKCGKSRIVWFNGNLKQDIVDYFQWKEKNGEETTPEAPFFLSSKTKNNIGKRALQRGFKRILAKAGIKLEYSIHAARHTYATHLLKSRGLSNRSR